MDDDLGVLGKVWRVGGDGLEGDELCLGDVDDFPFLLFADVDEEGVEVVVVEAGLEFGGGDGLHVGIGDLAGWICGGFVIVDGGDGGVFATEAARWIVGELEGAEGGGEGVVDEDFPEGWLAGAEDELDGLHGLEGADDAGEDAEDAGFVAGGDGAGCGYFREEATVAGTAKVGCEDGHLAVEAVDGSVDEGLFEEKGGVVGEEAGGEVVGAVEDDVVVFRDPDGVFRGEADGVEVEGDVGVCLAEAGGGGFELGFPDGGVAVEELALEV